MENKNEVLLEELKVLQQKVSNMEKWKRIKWKCFGLLVLGVIATVAYAATVSKPHTFTDGSTASASEVNANFDALFNLVNGNLDDANIQGISASKITSGTLDLARIPSSIGGTGSSNTLRYPDGIVGTSVNVSAGSSYTVPTGKTLYIASGLFPQGGKSFDSGIFGEGIVGIYDNGSSTQFSGFLVTKGVTVVNEIVTTSYTVPTGKTLYIHSTSLTNTWNNQASEITISSGYSVNDQGVTMISSGTSFTHSGFTGYLK